MFRRSARALCAPAYRTLTAAKTSIPARPVPKLSPVVTQPGFRQSSRAFATSVPWRAETDQSTIDATMEEITELYATARDEFEMAYEETEKGTIYAEEDRRAAREELTKLQEFFKKVAEGQDSFLAEEVKRRVGPRIRELENAVEAMEEMANAHD